MNNNFHSLPRFIPGRLREARESRGLTVEELGEAVGVSHQSISKYENGKSTPSPLVFDKITQVLNFPYMFFLKPKDQPLDEEVIFFRSRATASRKAKKIHQTRIKWVQEIHMYLEEILNFPSVDIPKFNTSEIYIPTKFEEIDEMAEQVRRYWGFGDGPISNVLLLLEKKGAIVARATFSDVKIDACSYWGSNGRPYIFLGNDKQSSVRSRFDIAHELGHLVLHSNLAAKELADKKNHSAIEKEANRFASAFLLPSGSFGMEVLNNLDHLVQMKKRWKVSIAAMAYRARDLGIFSDDQYTYLMKKMARNGWLKQEPLDDSLVFEQPVALKQAIELILKHQVKTKSDIVSEIGYPREEIEILCNLEPGALIEKEKMGGKIIQFKTKQH